MICPSDSRRSIVENTKLFFRTKQTQKLITNNQKQGLKNEKTFLKV